MINIPKKLTLYSYNMVILMTSMFLRVKRTQGRRDYAFKLIKYFKSYDILKVNTNWNSEKLIIWGAGISMGGLEKTPRIN